MKKLKKNQVAGRAAKASTAKREQHAMNQPLSEAQCRLVEHNVGFARAMAVKYREVGMLKGISLADLEQEACMGLCEAAQRFDDSLQVRFTTYANAWVKKYLLKAIDKEQYRSSDDVERLTDGSISYATCAFCDDDDAACAFCDDDATSAFYDDPSANVYDDAFEAGEEMQSARSSLQLEVMLSTLSKQEQQVVCLILGLSLKGGNQLPLTTKQVGQKLHLGPRRILQIYNRALTKLELTQVENN